MKTITFTIVFLYCLLSYGSEIETIYENLLNDSCVTAATIICGETVVGTTMDNTDAGGDNDSLDEWYSFTGNGSEEYIIFSLCSVGTTFDTYG